MVIYKGSRKNMKKRLIFIFLMIGIAIFTNSCINKDPEYSADELVCEYDSPDKTMTLKIYQGPPEDTIMVDFYVVGEVEFKDKKLFGKKMIYYEYHEEFQNAYWLDDKTVVINEKVVEITE